MVSEIETADSYNEISELFQALDEWISKGGFLPKDWKERV
jgi:hypothetical protein